MKKYVDYDIKDILTEISKISKKVLRDSEAALGNFGMDNNIDLFNLTNLALKIQKLNALASRHEYEDYVQSLTIQLEDEYGKRKIS